MSLIYKLKDIKTKNKELKQIYKKCKECNALLHINNYYKNKGCVNGRESVCKKCRDEKAKLRNEKVCAVCNKVFTSRKKNQLYCSSKCSGTSKENKLLVNCTYCEKELYRTEWEINKNTNGNFCNRDCQINWKKTKEKNNKKIRIVKCICERCGIEYETTEFKRDRQKYKYCSDKCRYPKLTFYCGTCGNEITSSPSRFKGREHYYCSVECERKDRKERFGRENNPSWNPNLTDEEREDKRKYPEYNEWRKEVFKRDNYTCKSCNTVGGKLNAHHINDYVNFPEQRLDLNNGITLCNICHKSFHKEYGFGNNNEGQFLEWMISSYDIAEGGEYRNEY